MKFIYEIACICQTELRRGIFLWRRKQRLERDAIARFSVVLHLLCARVSVDEYRLCVPVCLFAGVELVRRGSSCSIQRGGGSGAIAPGTRTSGDWATEGGRPEANGRRMRRAVEPEGQKGAPFMRWLRRHVPGANW
jgi:hypothetical protein